MEWVAVDCAKYYKGAVTDPSLKATYLSAMEVFRDLSPEEMVFKRAPGRLAMFQETVTQLLDEFKAQSLANLARRRKVITAATRLQEITNG